MRARNAVAVIRVLDHLHVRQPTHAKSELARVRTIHRAAAPNSGRTRTMALSSAYTCACVSFSSPDGSSSWNATAARMPKIGVSTGRAHTKRSRTSKEFGRDVRSNLRMDEMTENMIKPMRTLRSSASFSYRLHDRHSSDNNPRQLRASVKITRILCSKSVSRTHRRARRGGP